MQDEARHVSYGTLELKNFLDSSTDREKALRICIASPILASRSSSPH